MRTPHAPLIVLSDRFGGMDVAGLKVLRFSNFLEDLAEAGDGAHPAWTGPAPIALLLDATDHASLTGDALRAELVKALGAQVVKLAAKATDKALLAELAPILAAHTAALAAEGHAARAALAEIRAHHLALQSDYAELEAWIYDALAPDHKLARAWTPTAATLHLAPGQSVTQPLPVSARGVVTLDLHVATSVGTPATLALRIRRPDGGALAEPVETTLAPGAADWQRLSLPLPVGGPPQDGVAEITVHGASLDLSLAPETRFADLCATGPDGPLPAPLALRVYQSTSRMALPQLHDPRGPLPADGQMRLILPRDLAAPELLPYRSGSVPRPLRAYPDTVVTRVDEARNAILVHPSAHRPVVARVPGLEVERLTQLRAIVHLARHDTMEVSFAIGAAAEGTVPSAQAALAHLGDWQPVLPAAWGEAWCAFAEPLSGRIDLLLATAMPNAPFNTNAEALFRGIRTVAR